MATSRRYQKIAREIMKLLARNYWLAFTGKPDILQHSRRGMPVRRGRDMWQCHVCDDATLVAVSYDVNRGVAQLG